MKKIIIILIPLIFIFVINSFKFFVIKNKNKVSSEFKDKIYKSCLVYKNEIPTNEKQCHCIINKVDLSNKLELSKEVYFIDSKTELYIFEKDIMNQFKNKLKFKECFNVI
jgi:hypothetical protein